MTIAPPMARASPPIDAKDLQTLLAQLERKTHPRPIKTLRPRLNKDFAVMLMRSSYNALDELDCVSMEQFQRDFFIIRQAEYEPYVRALGDGFVQQGDLTDPYYFDFISFAQYSTINRDIKDAPFVFEEKQPQEVQEGEMQKFIPVVVKRDPTITNAMLPGEHSKKVGNAILNYFRETFGGTSSSLPEVDSDESPTLDQLNSALEQLVKLFLLNGFAFDGKLTASVDRQLFQILFVSPATLWGGSILQKQEVSNDFFLKSATMLISQYGHEVLKTSISYQGNEQTISIKIL